MKIACGTSGLRRLENAMIRPGPTTAAILAGITLSLTIPCSFAASVSGSSVAAVPGGLANPTLTFDFGAGYDLGAVDFSVVFDPAVFTLRSDLATVQYGGNTMSWTDALAALAAVTPPPSFLDTNLGPDTGDPSLQALSFSFLTGMDATFAFVPVPVSGTAVLTLPFEFHGTVPDVYTITVSGSLSDTGVLNGVGIEQHFDTSLVVTAVPEAGSWLLCASGLGLLVALRRRRA
jgi:hypothetical protein